MINHSFPGTYETLLSSLSLSMTDTGSNLTRHSSYTWLRDTCEEEDTCLLATQLRRRYEEVRSRAMERAGTEDSIAEAEQEEEVIINEIMLTSGMRFRELFVVMLRFLSHLKPPLFH